jgi:hypothetical protein
MRPRVGCRQPRCRWSGVRVRSNASDSSRRLRNAPSAWLGLRQGLKELGYEEGKNLRWDFRNLPDETAAQATAREFVRQRVDVMVAFEEQAVRAARAATSDIPILFLHVLSDPVAEGFARIRLVRTK